MSVFDLNFVLKKTQQQLKPLNQGSIGPLPDYSDPNQSNEFNIERTLAKTERMFENQKREQIKDIYETTFKINNNEPIDPKPYDPYKNTINNYSKNDDDPIDLKPYDPYKKTINNYGKYNNEPIDPKPYDPYKPSKRKKYPWEE